MPADTLQRRLSCRVSAPMLWLCLWALLRATVPAAAQAAADSVQPAHPLERADLEAFFDGIIPLQLERSDVAGASVLVMKDGQVLLEKGYGYADLKAGKPVNPDSTIFRLASISKLFTWVSIMQLEEQGKVNLDTDVNQYLDFQIRPAPHSVSDKPITLRNLMTHTSGFEESSSDVILVDAKKAVTLRDYLIQNQPNRLFPPGQIPAYSNYGVGLASYIVQRVSREPFEQYVQRHIFAPLGMIHSSFQQPLPKDLASLPSEGYRGNTTKAAVGFEIFNPVGAGGISSTASDMGRFGQALLNGGTLDGKTILKPETLALMWTPQFQASPQLPPQCMGFYQDWRNHLRWIGHEGDLIAFHSLFFVEPTQKLVLFVSYNSAGGGDQPRPEIIHFFSDRYFPGAPKVEYLKSFPAEMRQIAGTYVTTRRADSTKLAPGNLFEQRSVTVDKDGVLHIEHSRDLRGHPIRWRAVGKDLWQAEGEQARVFAIRDEKGGVARIAVAFPGVQYQRVPWYEKAVYVLSIGAVCLAQLLIVVIASLVSFILWLRGKKRNPKPRALSLTAGPRLAACVWILLLGAMGGFALSLGDDTLPPNPDWYLWFDVLNWATGLAILLSLWATIAGLRVVLRKELFVLTRVKFAVVAVACLFLTWFAVHWNLIGPSHRI
jgi:CubicO group peptidase (beta-lactamase class C family)